MNIVFACGNAFEPWDPAIARTRGVGGSELAVIEMSRRLAERGHDVSVYTNCEPCSHDRVSWRPTSELLDPRSLIECDVMVLWRNAGLVECPVDARARVLWVHDVHPMHLTMPRLARIDRVLALSSWQRAVLVAQDRIPPEKITVDRGGIDVARWSEVRARAVGAPHRAIYTSCPDRGLATLLELWPRIGERAVGATLEVTYGFDNSIAQAKSTGDTARLAWLEELAARARATEGVRVHGRLSRAEYELRVAMAGAWLYPTAYDENCPATAMEAMACGLRIVTSARAGLRELVGDRGVLLEGDPASPAYREAFVEAAARALSTEGGAARGTWMRHAREHFGWDALVPRWEALFEELLGTTSEGPSSGRSSPSRPGGGSEELGILRGSWRGGGEFALRCPPDMHGHVLEVLNGGYDVPGLEFDAPPRILDLGACVGDFAVWAAHRWPGAIIACFEPNPKAFALLEDNLRGTGVALHQAAVRAIAGSAPLYFGRQNLGEATFYGTETHTAGSVLVECASAMNLSDCDVLKIDTEGCEVEILREYLRRDGLPRAILLEFHSEEDRRHIDVILGGLYSLVRGRIAHAGMGTLCYVRAA